MMRKLVKYKLACTPYCHFDNRTSDCTVIRFMRVPVEKGKHTVTAHTTIPLSLHPHPNGTPPPPPPAPPHQVYMSLPLYSSTVPS